MLLDQPADGELVLGIDDRPQEADRDGLDLQRRQPLEDRNRGRLVERRPDGPVRHDALRHLEGQRLRDVGLGIGRREIEGFRPAAFAEDQRIGMTQRW